MSRQVIHNFSATRLASVWLVAIAILSAVSCVSAEAATVSVGAAQTASASSVETRATQMEIRKGINPWFAQAFLANIESIEDLHIRSVRVELPWELVQPSPDVFDWSKVDAVGDAAQAHGIDVLFTLRSVSSWATKHPLRGNDLFHNASFPLDLKNWDRFVKTLALRYKGRHVDYEIENEPNIPKFWNETRDEYLELLKASYRSIKENAPQARVLTAALACGIVFNYRNARIANRILENNDEWLRSILTTRAFDVLSVHDYYFPDHAENGWTFASYLTHIRNLARQAGVGKAPVWITETGYVASPTKAGGRTDEGSPERQAQWLQAAYKQAFELGVARVFWLFLRDHPNAGYFDAMGLMDVHGNVRPAWKVMQNIEAGGP